MYLIEHRVRILVNTDRQRRCYNGCNFSEELQWTGWGPLDSAKTEEASKVKMKFWRELNDYAISQRGESARRELRLVEVKS